MTRTHRTHPARILDRRLGTTSGSAHRHRLGSDPSVAADVRQWVASQLRSEAFFDSLLGPMRDLDA